MTADGRSATPITHTFSPKRGGVYLYQVEIRRRVGRGYWVRGVNVHFIKCLNNQLLTFAAYLEGLVQTKIWNWAGPHVRVGASQ